MSLSNSWPRPRNNLPITKALHLFKLLLIWTTVLRLHRPLIRFMLLLIHSEDVQVCHKLHMMRLQMTSMTSLRPPLHPHLRKSTAHLRLWQPTTLLPLGFQRHHQPIHVQLQLIHLVPMLDICTVASFSLLATIVVTVVAVITTILTRTSPRGSWEAISAVLLDVAEAQAHLYTISVMMKMPMAAFMIPMESMLPSILIPYP